MRKVSKSTIYENSHGNFIIKLIFLLMNSTFYCKINGKIKNDSRGLIIVNFLTEKQFLEPN
ncbi:MAG: hypothetical protein A3F91_03630 [Flavobacteria bacterium RIFCSPLOWO2_12_FULL_35_11]|nr:MAG: hypothetical protein A3F91_03630 [Flavobacteria bacterium RIFCSPLOWO2_12_FULL_35_11]